MKTGMNMNRRIEVIRTLHQADEGFLELTKNSGMRHHEEWSRWLKNRASYDQSIAVSDPN
jgi:hypothetical protein